MPDVAEDRCATAATPPTIRITAMLAPDRRGHAVREASFHSRDDHAWDLGPLGASLSRHAPGQETRLHAHDRATLHYVLGGLYVEHTDQGSVLALPGDLLLKPPGTPHWNGFGRLDAWTLRIEVTDELLAGLGGRGTPDVPRAVAAPWPLGRSLTTLAAALRGAPRSALRSTRRLRETLGGAVDSLAGTAADGPEPRAPVEVRARDLLARHRDAAPTVARLARELGVHRSHLTRRFRERYGCSPSEYLQLRRVARLAERLALGEAGLSRLAQEAGFADQSHGTRAFQRWLGSPPARWVTRRARARD